MLNCKCYVWYTSECIKYIWICWFLIWQMAHKTKAHMCLTHRQNTKKVCFIVITCWITTMKEGIQSKWSWHKVSTFISIRFLVYLPCPFRKNGHGTPTINSYDRLYAIRGSKRHPKTWFGTKVQIPNLEVESGIFNCESSASLCKPQPKSALGIFSCFR